MKEIGHHKAFVFSKKDEHAVVNAIKEVHKQLSSSSKSYGEMNARAKKFVTETNFLALRPFAHAEIIGLDCVTDGIFRYNRSETKNETLPKQITRLKVVNPKANERNKPTPLGLSVYFGEEGGGQTEDKSEPKQNQNEMGLQRRLCSSTSTVKSGFISACCSEYCFDQSKHVLQYTENSIRVISDVVRFLHRKNPEVRIIFRDQVTRAASAVVVQSAFRSWSTRVRLTPSLWDLVARKRATILLQLWWRANSTNSIKRRMRRLTMLNKLTKMIDNTTIYIEAELFYLLSNPAYSLKMVESMKKCDFHDIEFGFDEKVSATSHIRHQIPYTNQN